MATTIFGYYESLTNTGNGWQGFNQRIVISSSLLSESATKIKLSLSRANSTTWKFSDCYIGHVASAGDAYDFDGNQVRVTFDGGNNGATISYNHYESDEISFNLDSSKNLIIAFYYTDGSYDDIPRTGAGVITGITTYHKSSANEISTSNVSSYSTTGVGDLFCVSAILNLYEGFFSGHVYEINTSTPVSRTVRLYRRDTGGLVSSTTSSGDGYYYLETSYSGSHYIIALDNEGGTQYNLVALDWMLPVVPTTVS